MYVLGFFGAPRMVQNEPGMFIGPIATVFGWIIDAIFYVVHNITVYNSLGISIIFLTIIVRTLMLPLAFKQQQSMMAMQKLAPEVDKIRKRYPNKDKESQQNMNAEIQKLYSDNKVNPLGGCLPLLLQMPLFLGLSFIMHQSYLYVSRLGLLYTQISEYLINHVQGYTNIVVPLALPRVPQRMLENQEINISIPSHLNRVLNAFDAGDWDLLLSQIPANHMAVLQEWYGEKLAIENFFGMALTEATGIGWPGIVIPVLAVLSALLTSYVTMKASIVTDERAKQQQKIMMMVMPVVMGAMTIGLPAGVGIFWITSSLFQVGQQLILNKKMLVNTVPKKDTA